MQPYAPRALRALARRTRPARRTRSMLATIASVASFASLLPSSRAFAQTVTPASRAGSVEETGAAPVAVIELEPWRTRWTLRANVGGATRRLLLDTGAGITLLSPSALTAAGCTPWGRRTGYNMFGTRFDGPHCDDVALDIAGRRYAPAMVGRVDMAALNPADSLLEGIAGLDLFDGRVITLDLARGRIIVESPASLAARIASMHALPVRLKRELDGAALAAVVGVPSRQGSLWMELDSGNGGTILVSKPVAALVGLDSSVAGRQRADFALTDGVRVTSADAFTPDLIMDGNLGMPFLRQWIVTLDLGSGRAWIGPAAVQSAAAH